jgi:hypothetical protein
VPSAASWAKSIRFMSLHLLGTNLYTDCNYRTNNFSTNLIFVERILLRNVHVRIFQTYTRNRNWEFYWCYYISLLWVNASYEQRIVVLIHYIS